MIVYVASANKIDRAFTAAATNVGVEQSQVIHFVHQIYQAFIGSTYAKLFHKRTGLIVFTLLDFEGQFAHWVDDEIKAAPQSAGNIHRFSGQLLTLMQSTWCLDQGLVVRECLTDSDFKRTPTSSSKPLNQQTG
ncbi:MAG: hypothetical protein GY942_07320 [Aestuariibacter sp.]|nr:hypothetical protein [Aestuariibacter sp.]